MPPTTPLELFTRPPLGWVMALVWGALWGSFLNVAIYRIGKATLDEEAAAEARPEGTRWEELREHLRWIGKALYTLLRPARSFCPSCKALVRARDNVPLLGWLALGGRCRDCRAPISLRYPLVELLAILLAAGVYYRFVVLEPAPAAVQASRFFVDFGFGAVLLVLSAIDLDSTFLPDAILWPAIPAFFVARQALHDVPWQEAAIGVAVGYGGLKLLDLGYWLVRKKAGLGGGDAKLLALFAALLGWRVLPYALFGGAIVGTVVSVPLLLLRRAPPLDADGKPTTVGQAAVPFGPFLAAGALVYLFFGKALHALFLAWLLPGE